MNTLFDSRASHNSGFSYPLNILIFFSNQQRKKRETIHPDMDVETVADIVSDKLMKVVKKELDTITGSKTD
ncbi:MAG: hypothetical protein AAF806_26815 [Bacteroidota bacterium]